MKESKLPPIKGESRVMDSENTDDHSSTTQKESMPNSEMLQSCSRWSFKCILYNMERKKLKEAQTVAIYVNEYFVMQPHTNYKLVKLERFDRFE